MKGPILLTQHRTSLGPRAECQRSEKDSFALPSHCPLSPENPTRAPETGARPRRHAPVCALSALLSELLGAMRPHLTRLPRQTLGIQARQEIQSEPQGVSSETRVFPVLFLSHLCEGMLTPWLILSNCSFSPLQGFLCFSFLACLPRILHLLFFSFSSFIQF